MDAKTPDLAGSTAETVVASETVELEPTGETLAAPGPAMRPAGAPVAAGGRLGRYLIIDKLGEGGMGVVYAAYDPDLDRRVAVKVLRGAAREEAKARLVREARSMARLKHPNVVPVYDVGVVDDQVFVAMAYIEGQTLGAWCKGRPWREVLEAYLDAGEGLVAAHAAGLVHRDFKPDNVLVAGEGPKRRVYVLDFGLAKTHESAEGRAGDGAGPPPTDPGDDPVHRTLATPGQAEAPLGDSASSVLGSGASTELTRAGSIMGTPAFMAPEQHEGEPTDARSDQFSFAVSLYLGLYGQRPFDGDSILSIAFNVLRGEIRKPPADTRVAKWVFAVLERAMQTDPAARWPSMVELLAELRSDPIARRRNRIQAAVAVGLVGTLAVFAARPQEVERAAAPPPVCVRSVDSLEGLWSAEQREQVAQAFAAIDTPWAPDAHERVAQRVQAWTDTWLDQRVEACEATKVKHEQSDELLDLRMACLDDKRNETAAIVGALAKVDEAQAKRSAAILAQLPVLSACANAKALRAVAPMPTDPETVASIEALRADIAATKGLSSFEKHNEAIAQLEPMVAKAKTIGWLPLEAHAMHKLAIERSQAGSYAEATPELEAALWAGLAANDAHVVRHTLVTLIDNDGYFSGDEAAGVRWSAFLRAMHQRDGATPEQVSSLHSTLGRVYYKAKKQDLAQAELEQAIAIKREAGLDPSVNDLNTLGGILLARGDYDAALPMFERAVALEEAKSGPRHPALSFPLNNLALAHERLTHYDEAIELLVRTRELIEAGQGPKHPNIGLVEMNIAGMYTQMRVKGKGEANLERAVAVLTEALGPEHNIMGMVLTVKGEWMMVNERFDEAVESLEASLAVRAKALGPEHPDNALSHLWLGRALQLRGDWRRGERELSQALTMLGEHVGDPVDHGLAYRFAAEGLVHAGKAGEAEALFEKAEAKFAEGGPTGARQLKFMKEARG